MKRRNVNKQIKARRVKMPLDETTYLLQSPTNAKRLLSAVSQLNSGLA
jgi:PHD/YefM family antitoxin component YafN of YafNO toxin-antitoxin module